MKHDRGIRYEYREEVREELARHGVRPGPTTPPELVMSYLNDLYRYELRRLRDRLMAGEIPKPDYAAHVVELRRRYVLVSIPVRSWMKAR